MMKRFHVSIQSSRVGEMTSELHNYGYSVRLCYKEVCIVLAKYWEAFLRCHKLVIIMYNLFSKSRVKNYSY